MVGDTKERLDSGRSVDEDRSQGRLFLKWAGWSGLVATLAFIVTIVMSSAGSVAGPESADDMLRFATEVTDSGSTQYIYGVAGLVMVVLYMPMCAGLYRYLRRTTTAWYGTMAVISGLGILLPAYVINLLAPAALAPLVEELGASSAQSLYADYEIARVVAELFFTVGSVLTLAIGPFLWGIAWLDASKSSRWLGWIGLLTGITGAVWFVWLVDNALFGYLLILNVLLSLVLFAGVSVVLVAKARTSA